MPTTITRQEWEELATGDKIIGSLKHCWIVTRRDPQNSQRLFAQLRGYNNDTSLEWKDGEIVSDAGSLGEELNGPKVTIVKNPTPP